MLPEVEYLGHCISADGLKPLESKVRAIVEAPTPKNTTELKSFLGLLNYYRKFLPQLSSTLAPLNKLLRSNEPWVMDISTRDGFQKDEGDLAACLYILIKTKN